LKRCGVAPGVPVEVGTVVGVVIDVAMTGGLVGVGVTGWDVWLQDERKTRQNNIKEHRTVARFVIIDIL
jgi:hypothetical protein